MYAYMDMHTNTEHENWDYSLVVEESPSMRKSHSVPKPARRKARKEEENKGRGKQEKDGQESRPQGWQIL